jgi:hypothetical protein
MAVAAELVAAVSVALGALAAVLGALAGAAGLAAPPPAHATSEEVASKKRAIRLSMRLVRGMEGLLVELVARAHPTASHAWDGAAAYGAGVWVGSAPARAHALS